MIQRLQRLLLVLRHAIQMYRNLTLRRNLEKGTWINEDLRDLLSLMEKERDELRQACWEFEHGAGSVQRVAEEAADVSAFAAMVADAARKKSTN